MIPAAVPAALTGVVAGLPCGVWARWARESRCTPARAPQGPFRGFRDAEPLPKPADGRTEPHRPDRSRP